MTNNDDYCCSMLSGREIELEYIIVEKETLIIMPLADMLLEKASGEECSVFYPEEGKRNLSWSYKSLPHAVNFKIEISSCNIREAENIIHRQVIRANSILEDFAAVLLPASFHPFMDFAEITQENEQALYGKNIDIFFNLHFMTLVLPFRNSDEYYRLHSAVRLIMPLIPSLTSSSPLEESKFTGYLDSCMMLFRDRYSCINDSMISVIPEPAGEADYPAGKEPDNYRGKNMDLVSADFSRGKMIIRLFNMQESPHADFAIARFITYVLEILVNSGCREGKPAPVDSGELLSLFEDVIKEGMTAVTYSRYYLEMLGIEDQEKMSAWGIWMLLSKKVKDYSGLKFPPVENILKIGSLSERIIKSVKRSTVKETYHELIKCLEENRMMLV